MAPSFFFSYASQDRRLDPQENIKRFFDDLDSWVQRLGLDGGFFDSQGIKAGENWKAELRGVLATCPVLVPMYSPRYFLSAYCAYEWQPFFNSYTQAVAEGGSPASPILPVKWLMPGVTIPAPYADFQNPDEIFPPRVMDLSQLMSTRKHNERYLAFVRDFAARLVQMCRDVGPVANRLVGAVPDVNEVAAPLEGAATESGAQYVRCLFVAGLRREIVPPRRFTDCYGSDVNRTDWRPCFPTKDRVAADIVEEVARREGRVVRYLTPGPNVLQAIGQTERHNNTVIIVVDPWSLSIGEWQRFVDDFDRTLLKNCGVLVVWNREDPDTNLGLPLFSQVIRDRFDRHINLTNTFFRQSVTSIEEFQQALVDAFHAIRANLVSEGKAASIRQGMTESQPLVSI